MRHHGQSVDTCVGSTCAMHVAVDTGQVVHRLLQFTLHRSLARGLPLPTLEVRAIELEGEFEASLFRFYAHLFGHVGTVPRKKRSARPLLLPSRSLAEGCACEHRRMALPPLEDSIVAIATAPGTGAIGVVRLSGPEAYAVADALFRTRNGHRPSESSGGRILVGTIEDQDELIDEAVLLTFRSPHSYTGQDVVEFQSHGGPAVLRRVVEACVARGVRRAGPGEFTLRSYVAGKRTLVEAESVLTMVNAQGERARRAAMHGLSNRLGQELHRLQDTLTSCLGDLTAALDYPEEGVELVDVRPRLRDVRLDIQALLATASASSLAQNGARLAIVGRPNAGKSSLLNALLGYDRSIVSDTPGTTRDYLEALFEIDGIPITAIDTAGVRVTDDVIEAAGVQHATTLAEHADVVLCLLDASAPLEEGDLEILERFRSERSLVVLTKIDLADSWQRTTPVPSGFEVVRVSSHEGTGLDTLKQRIADLLLADVGASEVWISHERHAEALQRVESAVARALDAPDDLMGLDLQDAVQELAQLTGRSEIAEDVLEHIFANFCVGK